jgi:hypothetical protein
VTWGGAHAHAAVQEEALLMMQKNRIDNLSKQQTEMQEMLNILQRTDYVINRRKDQLDKAQRQRPRP